jgi:hypothetical protein
VEVMNEAGVRKGKRGASVLGLRPLDLRFEGRSCLGAKGFCVEVFGRCSYNGVASYHRM